MLAGHSPWRGAEAPRIRLGGPWPGAMTTSHPGAHPHHRSRQHGPWRGRRPAAPSECPEARRAQKKRWRLPEPEVLPAPQREPAPLPEPELLPTPQLLPTPLPAPELLLEPVPEVLPLPALELLPAPAPLPQKLV